MSDLAQRLGGIERALDSGAYRPGPWQAFLEEVESSPSGEVACLEDTITRVSDKLHRRRGPRCFRFDSALGCEILAGFFGLALLAWGASISSPALMGIAAAVLATAFQPLLKVSTGLVLGIRFSYAYLSHGEPRFKLAYGRYLSAQRWRRIALHLAGTLGSPFAWLLVSVVARPTHPGMGTVLAWLGVSHLAFQAVLFVCVLAGVRRLPLIGLLRFSSPGAAAHALQPDRPRSR